MASNEIPGFMWGVVVDNEDPLNMGRVLWKREGLYEPHHPEWASPLGWPGGGGQTYGSRYPTPVGAQVAILFEHGDPEAPACFLPGPYGLNGSGGSLTWPELDQELVLKSANGVADASPLEVAVIWEDDTFRAFVVNKSTAGEEDKRFVLIEKTTGSGIVLNATDGDSGKSITLTLSANTGISIQANGVIDIQGTSVQIQGRRVVRKPGVTTI